MTQNHRESQGRKRQQRPVSAPRATSEEPRRLCILPGIENADGEPLVAWASGSRRRPLLQAFGSIAAALAAGRSAG